jgi:D-apionolactonase
MSLQSISCGRLSFLFDDADGHVRHVQRDGVEVLRGIYAAVRDRNWDTVAPRLMELRTERGDNRVTLTFSVECADAAVDFIWRGKIVLDAPSSQLTYTFSGQARRPFLKNRIGFCILHAAECAGEPVLVEQSDGSRREGKFPAQISPHQPFLNVRALTHRPAPGLVARVEMTGDTFETEDQRNWTDSSFKTYCTPLGVPFPVEVSAGQSVEQAVTLTITTETKYSPSSGRAANGRTFMCWRKAGVVLQPLPPLGFCVSRDAASCNSSRDQSQLAALRPAHVRVDLRGATADWKRRLLAAQEEARPAGAKLEVAVHLAAPPPEPELLSLKAAVEAGDLAGSIVRWLIFCTKENTTGAVLVEEARRHLRTVTPGALFVGGTDAYFAELNRGQSSATAADALTFSINPQVHAFDDLSLIETLSMQGEVVKNGRRLANGKPVVVSPVTLRPRFNPNRTAAASTDPTDDVIAMTDPRQRTVFGALWTLGSIKYLAEAGAAAITYYRTRGPDGLQAADAVSASVPLQEANSAADSRFPVWWVFRLLADFAGGQVIPLETADPFRGVALLLAQGGRRRLLFAHFGSIPWPFDLAADLRPDSSGQVIVSEGASRGEKVEHALPPRSLVQWDWTARN